MSALAARARGLTGRLAETDGAPTDVLAVLERWDIDHDLAFLTLEADLRALRAIIRGLAAGVPAERRGAAAGRLTDLAGASSLGELVAKLGPHPLAPALSTTEVIDVFAIEAALARAYGAAARPRDAAARLHVSQVIDGANASAALLLAARGRGLDAAAMFVTGGDRLDAPTFERAARGPLPMARALLATAFAGTPLASAVDSSEPGAIEQATLAWQLAAQQRLRRLAPHGLAPVIYVALRTRERAARWRREAWTRMLGGVR